MMHRFGGKARIATLLAVMGALALATPALAAGGSSGAAAAGRMPGAPVSRATGCFPGSPPCHSDAFAGWASDRAFKETVETTTIKLPKLECGSTDQAIGPNVGADGSTSAGIFVGCYGGTAHYWPAFVLDGVGKNYPELAAHAGDTVVLTASLNKTETKLSVRDKTTKSASMALTGAGITQIVGPYVGDEGFVTANMLLSVPNFGKLAFSQTMFNGKPLWLAQRTSFVKFNRYNQSTEQIATGSFDSTGTVFKTVFKHS